MKSVRTQTIALVQVMGILLVVGLVVVLVDGQLSKGSVVRTGGVVLIEHDRPRLFTGRNVAGQGVDGTLTRLPNGCVGLLVGAEGGPEQSPVVWGHGTKLVSADPLTIEFGGTTYVEGDTIVAGGYEASASGDPLLEQVPPACRFDSYLFIY